MFREMRRKNQDLPKALCEEILNKASSGVLAVLGDENYPYAVPLSFVYYKGGIYFHCAKEGHKLDAIRAHSKVSFCVTDADEVVPEEYTTYYRSVIVFGKAAILTSIDKMREPLTALTEKYCPAQQDKKSRVEGGMSSMATIRVDIEHMTGKEGKALAQKRRENE